MPKIADFAEAVQIFANHYGDEWIAGAEHDQFYMVDDSKHLLTSDEQDKLLDWGWWKDEDGCWTRFI